MNWIDCFHGVTTWKSVYVYQMQRMSEKKGTSAKFSKNWIRQILKRRRLRRCTYFSTRQKLLSRNEGIKKYQKEFFGPTSLKQIPPWPPLGFHTLLMRDEVSPLDVHMLAICNAISRSLPFATSVSTILSQSLGYGHAVLNLCDSPFKVAKSAAVKN